MKTTGRFLTLLLFGGALLALPQLTRKIHAQWPASQCITSFSSSWDDPCPNCCANAGLEIYEIDTPNDTSPGDKSALLQTFDCGGGTNCNGCGSGEYYEETDDPTCCGSNGAYCGSDSDCCNGLLCADGMCSWCRNYGDQCSDGSECCSGLCDSGTYTCVDCLTEFEACQSDFDCCTGVCQYGFCSAT